MRYEGIEGRNAVQTDAASLPTRFPLQSQPVIHFLRRIIFQHAFLYVRLHPFFDLRIMNYGILGRILFQINSLEPNRVVSPIQSAFFIFMTRQPFVNENGPASSMSRSSAG